MALETNVERAARLDLKPAPTLQGYYWSPAEIAETIHWNQKVEHLGEVQGKRLGPKYRGLFLHLTPSCDLNCWFCYSEREQLINGKVQIGLTENELKQCLDDSRQFGMESVIVAGRGEPFLDPALLPLARYASKQGQRFIVATHNGLITPEIARELYSLNTTIFAKLGSLNPETQEAIVGKKGAHQMIYEGLDNLLAAGFRQPRLAINHTLQRSTLNDSFEVFRYCRQKGIIPYFEALIEEGCALKHPYKLREEKLDDDELSHFFTQVREIDEAEFGYTWTIGPGLHSLGYEECRKSLTMITIHENGEVTTCVNVKKPILGNVHQQPFAEIINGSSDLRALRREALATCCSRTIQCYNPSTNPLRKQY